MRFDVLFFLLCLASTVFGASGLDKEGFAKVATNENFKKLVMDADQDALIEFYAPWCGHCKNLAPAYEMLAEKLANEDVIIAKFDAQASDIPSLFDVRGYPTLYWLPKNAKDSPMAYRGGRDVDDFVKFISKHSTDGLKEYDRDGKLATEKPIEDEAEIKANERVVDEQKVVKEAVTKNFKELVLDAEKDVLVQFYAPWCGFCKQFAPTYEKLAEQLIKEDVAIVKMDVTVNELEPLFDVYSVPTLFWLPKNAKGTPLRYVGNRELDDLIKFVAKHSTDGLKAFGHDGKKKTDETVDEPVPIAKEEAVAENEDFAKKEDFAVKDIMEMEEIFNDEL